MKKRNPIFLILLLLLAIVLTVGLVYVNYMTRAIYGLPGKSVSSVSALKHGLLLYQGREKMLATATGNRLPEVKVSVEPDQSVQELCANLEQKSLVQSADLTCAYLVYSGQDRSIQPGNYTVPMGLNAIEIADLISDVTQRDKQFTIYAGWRMEEIDSLFDGLGFSFSGADFLTLATAPPEPYREQLEIPARDDP